MVELGNELKRKGAKIRKYILERGLRYENILQGGAKKSIKLKPFSIFPYKEFKSPYSKLEAGYSFK